MRARSSQAPPAARRKIAFDLFDSDGSSQVSGCNTVTVMCSGATYSSSQWIMNAPGAAAAPGRDCHRYHSMRW